MSFLKYFKERAEAQAFQKLKRKRLGGAFLGARKRQSFIDRLKFRKQKSLEI